MKWIDLREAEGQEFTVLRTFCDNCAGQNKNLYIVLAALHLIHMRKLVRIELVFMVSGHSFLPCDRAFGIIEKKIRVTEDLHTTAHYMKLMRLAKKPPYEVVALERKDIFNMKDMTKYVSTSRQRPVSFKGASQLVITAAYKEGYIIKTDHDFKDTSTNTHRCRLMKGNKRYSSKAFDLSTVPLSQKYQTDRLLNKNKVKDLQRFIPYVDGSVSKQWLLDLISRQKKLLHGQEAQGLDSEDGSDSENELLDYDY